MKRSQTMLSRTLSFLGVAVLAVPSVAQQDTLWVTDKGSGMVRLVNANGIDQIPPAAIHADAELSVDSTGAAWALCSTASRIKRLSTTGDILLDLATALEPIAIAIDAEDRAWVISAEGRRLQRFDAQGQIGVDIALPAIPSDIAIDATGQIWVALRSRRVHRYDSEGTLLGTVRGLRGDLRLAVSHFGFLFVASRNAKRIWRLDLDTGEVLAEQRVRDRIGDLVADRLGRIWYTLPKEHLLVRQDANGGGNAWILTATKPEQLAIDLNGTLWVASEGEGLLQRFDDRGVHLGNVASGIFGLAGDRAGAHVHAVLHPYGDLDNDGFANRSEWIGSSRLDDATSIPAGITHNVIAPGIHELWIEAASLPRMAYSAFLTTSAFPGMSLSLLDGHDQRILPTDFGDPLFLGTVLQPGLISAPFGQLDALGRARLQVFIPPDISLPVPIDFAFVVLGDTYAPHFIRAISKPERLLSPPQ